MASRSLIESLYKKLLALYPKEFRDQLGDSMEQTWKDQFRERVHAGEDTSVFILKTFTETFFGIINEHIFYTHMTLNNRSALIGFLLFLPLFILNIFKGMGIEPLDNFFSGVFSLHMLETNPVGSIVIFLIIMALPVGAIIALRPFFKRSPEVKRKFYPLNALIALISIVSFVGFGALIVDTIHCETQMEAKYCD